MVHFKRHGKCCGVFLFMGGSVAHFLYCFAPRAYVLRAFYFRTMQFHAW